MQRRRKKKQANNNTSTVLVRLDHIVFQRLKSMIDYGPAGSPNGVIRKMLGLEPLHRGPKSKAEQSAA